MKTLFQKQRHHKPASRLKPAGSVGVICLLLIALLCSCGAAPARTEAAPQSAGASAPDAAQTAVSAPAPTAAPAPTPTPTPTPESTPDPEALEQQARQQRLSEAKDGFLWEEGWLRAVDAEGNLITDDYVGVLHFDVAGYYTSGNEDLDVLVAKIISENTDSAMTRMEMLRAMYDYILENVDYAGLMNYENSTKPAHGKDGWMPKSALQALRNQFTF